MISHGLMAGRNRLGTLQFDAHRGSLVRRVGFRGIGHRLRIGRSWPFSAITDRARVAPEWTPPMFSKARRSPGAAVTPIRRCRSRSLSFRAEPHA